MSARILLLDIETSPTVADVWSLRDFNVGLSQIVEHPRCIMVGAKWYGEKSVKCYDEYHNGRDVMLEKTHAMLDEADIAIHYNGNGFDIPWLGGEFAREDMLPPSPVRNIDLYRVTRKAFRFPSHKLQYVSGALGIGSKVTHAGHQMWQDCLRGDEETKRKAWARMRTYCKQDVALLEPLYEKLRPWIGNHPNLALYGEAALGEDGKALGISECPNCQSPDLQRRGFAVKQTRRYQRFQCQGCGTWTQDTRSDLSMKLEQTGVVR